jgi:hypothetical protein
MFVIVAISLMLGLTPCSGSPLGRDTSDDRPRLDTSTGNDNEQIAPDNFDANIRGKSAFLFSSLLSSVVFSFHLQILYQRTFMYGVYRELFCEGKLQWDCWAVHASSRTNLIGRKFTSLLRSREKCQFTCQL